MSTSGEDSVVGSGDRTSAYEPPRLVPIGSLHDLLAGGGTQNCDQGAPDPSNGSDNLCL
jgi:hypothetical protein